MPKVSAIIADDEEHLRVHLKSKLLRLWPELTICGEAENGLEALELIKRNHPDIVFLDIKMPGLSGIEVAKRIVAVCRVVFVTAYDEYAIEAFENEAIDYVLKPVTQERLQKTVKRLQQHLNAPPPPGLAQTLDRLLSVIKTKDAPGYLEWIRARQRESVQLISVKEICYFKAEDKYTAVKTREGEFLIKTSIRELSEALDPNQFWRIHRGTIVNVGQIASAHRAFTGTYALRLKGLPETLTVSRSYAHLFKHM